VHLFGNAPICASTVFECSYCRIHRCVTAPLLHRKDKANGFHSYYLSLFLHQWKMEQGGMLGWDSNCACETTLDLVSCLFMTMGGLRLCYKLYKDACPVTTSNFYHRSKQRGLKYTEHKSFGRHYLGVTRTTMSFAVWTLTQGEVRIGIMAIVVYNCC
jgi:hypothetical protein